MILIISTDFDTSTYKIEDWLQYYNADFIRINASSIATQLKYLNTSNNIFEFDNGNLIDPKEIRVVFNRKWFPNDYLNNHFDIDEHVNIVNFLKRENEELGSYFKNQFSHAKWIDHDIYKDINKLDQLRIAKQSGLNIPETIITSNKKDLLEFYQKHNRSIITKPLISHLVYQKSENLFSTYTEKITPEFIDRLSDRFHPSIFQEYIEKSFEIRSMYLDGLVYSLAYFSQQNELTSIDYRNGTDIVSFKTEVFELPLNLKACLITFMKNAKLISGSFDLICTPQNEYYFVEINPSGIFENISHYGNYNIEKDVAKLLIKYDT